MPQNNQPIVMTTKVRAQLIHHLWMILLILPTAIFIGQVKRVQELLQCQLQIAETIQCNNAKSFLQDDTRST